MSEIVRYRSVHSIRLALLAKAREAALTAVQTYNNPLVRFKSETYIVLMTIAWTYLLHAHFRDKHIDYRYLNTDPNRRGKYARIAGGGYKWWELSACLSSPLCPLDSGTVNNLRFLIGLRNEIEHHLPPHLDDYLSGRYVACALNFEYWLTTLFGEAYSLGGSLAWAIQFRDLTLPVEPEATPKLPAKLASWIQQFDDSLTPQEFGDHRFAFRMRFVRKVVSKPGQADRAIEFVAPGAPGVEDIPPEHVLLKETEKPKYRPKDIVALAKKSGYGWFTIPYHCDLWKSKDAKNPALGLGVEVSGQWYWYQRWVDEVLAFCAQRQSELDAHRQRT